MRQFGYRSLRALISSSLVLICLACSPSGEGSEIVPVDAGTSEDVRTDTDITRDASVAADSGNGGDDTSNEAGRGPITPYFAEISESVGLDFRHDNGMDGQQFFNEVVGSGAAFIDFDGDGDQDLYLVNGHLLRAGQGSEQSTSEIGDRLYQNTLVPTGKLGFQDVTEKSGLRSNGYGMGVATGDFDNDGHIDLYVTNWGANQLWRNFGDGRFENVTAEAGVGDDRWSISATFFDADRDGDLDLYVANYEVYDIASHRQCYDNVGREAYCGPSSYPYQSDRFYRNLGQGRFEDASEYVGVATVKAPGLGVMAADLDGDGWQDLYVANDGAENQLWLNQEGELFLDQALMSGTAINEMGVAEASMGLVAEDLDSDGDVDLFMTHLDQETNTLYLNDGTANFEDASDDSGLGRPSSPLTAFGVVPIDLENDGWLDLYVANGAVDVLDEQRQAGEEHPLKMPDQLYRNLGDASFEEVTASGGESFDRLAVGRGAAAGDIDNDGDRDVVIMNNAGPVWLLENQLGQDSDWLGLRVMDVEGKRDMLGAKVTLRMEGESSRSMHVHSDGSYASANDPRLIFGLGAAPDESKFEIEVRWPDGLRETFDQIESGRYNELRQGAGRPVTVDSESRVPDISKKELDSGADA